MNPNEPVRRPGRRGPRRGGRGNRQGQHRDGGLRVQDVYAAQIPVVPGVVGQPHPNQAQVGHVGGWGPVQPIPYGVQVYGTPHPTGAQPWNQGWTVAVQNNPFGNQIGGPVPAIPHGVQTFEPVYPPQVPYGNQVWIQDPNHRDNNHPYQPRRQQNHGHIRRRRQRPGRRQLQPGGQRARVGPGQLRFVVLEIEQVEGAISVQLRGQAVENARNHEAVERRNDRPAGREREDRVGAP